MPDEPEYLTVEEIIEINKKVLFEIRVKKGDTHRVANRSKIENVLSEVEESEGDTFRKAAILLIGLTKAHAFDSGNRRTAYAAAQLFLKANGESVGVEVDPRF